MSFLSQLQSICEIYPVTFTVMLVCGVVCFVPSLLLLTAVLRSSIHPNCRTMMFLWIAAQLLVYATVAWLALQSIITQKTFFNSGFVATEDHGFILKIYIPIWITSTCFELGISLERGVSIYKPTKYHGSSPAYCSIFAYFVFSVAFGYRVGTWVPAGGETIEAALGTIFSNLMDIGAFTTNVVVLIFAQRKKKAAHKHLNERYQIRESYLIARAMMPVYCLSTTLKVVIIIVNWLYVASMIPQAVSEVLYLSLSEVCCGLTSMMFLLHHTRLRGKLDGIIGKDLNNARSKAENINNDTIDNHFRMLFKSWN